MPFNERLGKTSVEGGGFEVHVSLFEFKFPENEPPSWVDVHARECVERLGS
jgi:hypothetical protein